VSRKTRFRTDIQTKSYASWCWAPSEEQNEKVEKPDTDCRHGCRDVGTLPELKNPDALKWEKTIPALGRNSPEYAILHVDPSTNLTTLMFRTPVAVHIKAHTHDLAETHVVLIGGTHVFKSNAVLYHIENGGFFRMPGGLVHEAWLPAGSQTLNILEGGWAVNWVHGGPSEEDMDQFPPTTAR
jgi:hypothetical protein